MNDGPQKILRTVKTEIMSDDEEDKIVEEYDVVMCEEIAHSEMYHIQFPARKKGVFKEDANPRVRFKKNVRLLEMRLSADTNTGSFDKTKVDKQMGSESSNVKKETGASKHDEIYEGRAYVNDNPLQYAVGYVTDGVVYLCPVAGNFEMRRSMVHLNTKVKTKDEDVEMLSDSDTESNSVSAGKQLRVKFARPETERQKKRREASALHREKMLASDQWIAMHVHLNQDKQVAAKRSALTPKAPEQISVPSVNTMELVHKAILCEKIEQLDLSRRDQLMSQQRIRNLPAHMQVKAVAIKAQVLSMFTAQSLVDNTISRADLIEALSKCSHLVRGVWVLNSDLLFQNLPPAQSNTPGKVDAHRSEVWRHARDLCLCLLDAQLPVTRATLSRCFRLNAKDAEDILSTIAIRCPGGGGWKLKIQDEEFLVSPENLALVVAERKYWQERWADLQTKIDRSTSPKRPRTSSSRGDKSD